MADDVKELEEQLRKSREALDREKEVLGLLEKWKEDLQQLEGDQTGELDRRQKELDGFAFEKHTAYVPNIETPLPKDFKTLGNQGDKEKEISRGRIDKLLGETADAHDKKIGMREDMKLKVRSLAEYDAMTDEVRGLFEQIESENHSWAWQKWARERAMDQNRWNTREELSEASAYYDARKEAYKEKDDAYQKEKDPEKKKALLQERNDARQEYYNSAMARRLLQKQAIKAAIAEENARIERHNEEENKRKKESDKIKDQKTLDERFLSETNSSVRWGKAKSVGLMAGSMVLDFADTLTDTISENILKGGSWIAEGIAKGQVVQEENVLKDLEENQAIMATAIVAAHNNANDSFGKAKKILQGNGNQMTQETADHLADAAESGKNGMSAAESFQELEEQIRQQQEKIREAEKTRDAQIKEIEERLNGAQRKSAREQKDNARLEAEKNRALGQALIGHLLSEPENGKAPSDSVISQQVMQDMEKAGIDQRQRKVMVEEAAAIRKERDLQNKLKELQTLSENIKTLMTPDNLQKIDTMVEIVEKFCEMYEKAVDFVKGKAGKDEDEKEKDGKEEEKDSEEKDAKEDSDKKDSEEKDAEEDEDEDELDVRKTLADLNEKAKKISEALSGSEEPQATIMQNLTDLTLECGDVVRIVSGKIHDISSRMENDLAEVRARTLAETEFLEDAKANKSISAVKLAQQELQEERTFLNEMHRNDMAVAESAIVSQRAKTDAAEQELKELESRLEKARLAAQQEKGAEQEKDASVAPEQKPEEKAEEKEPVSVPETEEIQNARAGLQAAHALTEERESAAKEAEEELRKKEGIEKEAQKELTDRKVEKTAADLVEKRDRKEDEVYFDQRRDKEFLEKKEETVKDVVWKDRKATVKSAVLNFADDAVAHAKSFMDQLTIGASEAIVRGKVKELEDELKDRQEEYDLKGKTLAAKNRSRFHHAKEAEALKANPNEQDKYHMEVKAGADLSIDIDRIRADRGRLGKEIVSMQENLVVARKERDEQLEELDQKLRDHFKIDRKSAKQQMDAAAGVNAIKGKQAVDEVAAMLSRDASQSAYDIADVLTSRAYTDTDAAARRAMKEESELLGELKKGDQKIKDLQELSEQLKGLFTPKNLSRVDTIVDAAEGLYKIYGKVREIMEGEFEGDDKEEKKDEKDSDEDEKSFAEKVADMKEKVSGVRQKLLSEEKEETHEVVDSILELAETMRDVTEKIAEKIHKAAEDAEKKKKALHEVRKNEEREIEEVKNRMEMDPQHTRSAAQHYWDQRQLLKEQNDVVMNKAITDAQSVLEEAHQDHESAKEQYQQKKDALEQAKKQEAEAQEKLDKLIAEETEKKAREEAEKKAREDAEKKAREEAEKKAREEAEKKAREEAEKKAREEAEKKAREEAEKKAREEAEKKAREEAEKKAREEAEKKAREEAEKKAREEAEKKAREEAEKKAREEAEKKAREEAARKAREEAAQRAREEAERRVREEAEKKAREEAEKKAREEAARKAREEAAQRAREEAERRVREEAERRQREEEQRRREEQERAKQPGEGMQFLAEIKGIDPKAAMDEKSFLDMMDSIYINGLAASSYLKMSAPDLKIVPESAEEIGKHLKGIVDQGKTNPIASTFVAVENEEGKLMPVLAQAEPGNLTASVNAQKYNRRAAQMHEDLNQTRMMALDGYQKMKQQPEAAHSGEDLRQQALVEAVRISEGDGLKRKKVGLSALMSREDKKPKIDYAAERAKNNPQQTMGKDPHGRTK